MRLKRMLIWSVSFIKPGYAVAIYYNQDFYLLLEGITMSKELKKVYSITVIQVVIYVIAFAMAFLNRGSHRTGPSTWS